MNFAEAKRGKREEESLEVGLIPATNTDHTVKQPATRKHTGLRTETKIFWELGGVEGDEEPRQLMGRELGVGGGNPLSHAFGMLLFFNTHIKNNITTKFHNLSFSLGKELKKKKKHKKD